MNIFLTGSTGFIGKALLQRLVKEGHTVYCYYRGQSINLLDSSIVVHCAGEIYKENEMVESNILLTDRLLQESKKKGIQKFIYFGSSSEYGQKLYRMYEKDHLEPITMYGATKGCGSLLTSVSGLNATIIRPFSVYGPGEPKHRFLPVIYDAAVSDKNLVIAPGYHDFIYIDDLVDVTFCAISRGKEIINVGTGEQFSNSEVVEIFEEVLGNPIKNKFYQQEKLRTYDTDKWSSDPSYLKSFYSKPLVSFRDGVTKYVQYRKENSAY